MHECQLLQLQQKQRRLCITFLTCTKKLRRTTIHVVVVTIFLRCIIDLMMFVLSLRKNSLHGFMNDDRFKINTNPMIHSNKIVNPFMQFLFFYLFLFQFFYSLFCLFYFVITFENQSFEDKKLSPTTQLIILRHIFFFCFLFYLFQMPHIN